MSRLLSVGVVLLVGLGCLVGCQSTYQQPESDFLGLVVGTYSQKGSKGIYTVQYDTVNQSFSAPKLVARAENPSFIKMSPKYMYVVNEVEVGRVSAYRKVDEFFKLEKMADVGGASPCYLSLSPGGKQLATANYMGGNISVFQMKDGVTQGPPTVLQHEGSGPNPQRQEAPHAHWVQWHPNNKWLYAVDLGTDEVKVYDVKTLVGRTAAKLLPGDGPRHMVFHPKLKLAYVLNELSNTLVTLNINSDGTLTEINRASTLPADFKEHSQAAHIALNRAATHLYVSNRGHNSIAVFSVDKVGGASLIQHESTGGNWPRHFSLVAKDRALVVANQESDNLMAMKINEDGRLGFAGGIVNVPQPTFVAPL